MYDDTIFCKRFETFRRVLTYSVLTRTMNDRTVSTYTIVEALSAPELGRGGFIFASVTITHSAYSYEIRQHFLTDLQCQNGRQISVQRESYRSKQRFTPTV